MYRKKCGADVGRCFHDLAHVNLYECTKTGYRFWRPSNIAGDEYFYQQLSAAWTTYYQTERWEYPAARRAIQNSKRVLEIGCGKGYFLRSIEGQVGDGLGLELNHGAINGKVTKFCVEPMTIEALSEGGCEQFDAICAFQVLEHVSSPGTFIESALACLLPRGVLVLSTPNYNYEDHWQQLDAFDLPPHHMGHFRESTFRKIAEVFDLDVVSVISQPRKHVTERVTHTTRSSLTYQLARAIARGAYSFVYYMSNEPGPNILAILRKR